MTIPSTSATKEYAVAAAAKSSSPPPHPLQAMVRIISPATLEAGSTFEAEVDGRKFIVTVPEGGVGKGDDFVVPYPTYNNSSNEKHQEPVAFATAVLTAPADTAADPLAMANKNSNNQMVTNEFNAFEVPKGKWRYDLCGCCEACCCPCMMGWCCFPILLAQVIERLKYTVFGCPNDGQNCASTSKQQPVCLVFTVLFVLVIIIEITLNVLVQNNGVCSYNEYGTYVCTYDVFMKAPAYVQILVWILIIYGWFVFIVSCCARMNMRKQFHIDPICCCGDNCCDDCCTSWCCYCCSTIQMERHTHDHDLYPYNVISRTGLHSSAPEIIV